MQTLYKSWCIMLEMIADRGFIVPDDYKFDNDEDFIVWAGDDEMSARKTMTAVFESEKGKKIGVYWTLNYGKDDIQRIYEQMTEDDVKHSIVVYGNKITAATAGVINHLRVQGCIVESFHERELQYNVTKSKWVPQHIICSAKTKEKVLSSYNITPAGLPVIKTTDPVVRYLGAVKGQLIKIKRPSESVKEVMVDGKPKPLFDISYRIVA